jgi:hypothetical protein
MSSTATVIQPLPTPDIHITTTRRHTWVCAQVNCDGVHHYWRRAL